jgi:hypothetical protein
VTADRGRTASDVPGRFLARGFAIARDGRLAAAAGLAVVLVVAAVTLPVLLQEGTRDWTIYAHAAERLRAGQPLYLFQQSAAREAYFLYPPLMALAWPLIGSPEALLVLKLVALLGVSSLVRILPVAERRLEGAVLAAALYAAALLVVPDIHDAVLGNVMLLYVGSVAWSVTQRGWSGAIPLGAVLAVAAKPAVVPYLIWLLVRRPADAGRVVASAAAVSLAAAFVVGPGQYVEYFRALPAMSVLLQLQGGNAGLSSISTAAAAVGAVGGLAVTVWSAVRLDPARGAAVAIASSLVVQPTIGLNYGGLLLPAVVCLWAADRAAGFIALSVVPVAVIVSPPLAAILLIALSVLPLGDRRARVGLADRGVDEPAAAGGHG